VNIVENEIYYYQHKQQDTNVNVSLLMDFLKDEELYCEKIERKHHAFPTFTYLSTLSKQQNVRQKPTN